MTFILIITSISVKGWKEKTVENYFIRKHFLFVDTLIFFKKTAMLRIN